MPAVPRHRADRLAPGRLGLDGHLPVVRGHRPGHPRPRRPGRAPRRRPLSRRTTPPSESALDEGPKLGAPALEPRAQAADATPSMPSLRAPALLSAPRWRSAAALAAPAAHAALCRLQHDQTTLADAPNDGVVARRRRRSSSASAREHGPVDGHRAAGDALLADATGVTVTQGSSAYPDIAAGATAANATPFTVACRRRCRAGRRSTSR